MGLSFNDRSLICQKRSANKTVEESIIDHIFNDDYSGASLSLTMDRKYSREGRLPGCNSQEKVIRAYSYLWN